MSAEKVAESLELTEAYLRALQNATEEFLNTHPAVLSAPQFIRCAQDAVASFSHDDMWSTHSPAPVSPGRVRKPIRAYIDGCFDIMHSGHFNAVRQAKALCDVLVVGVHSCEEIERHKGPPVMNDEERVGLVKACKWVDEVAFGTPYNPSLQVLDELNCDFCIHGDDIATTADGKDAYDEVRSAGRLRIIKRTAGVSTTDLVGRLLLMTKNHHTATTPIPSFSIASPSPHSLVNPPHFFSGSSHVHLASSEPHGGPASGSLAAPPVVNHQPMPHPAAASPPATVCLPPPSPKQNPSLLSPRRSPSHRSGGVQAPTPSEDPIASVVATVAVPEVDLKPTSVIAQPSLPAVPEGEAKHYAAGITSFLPTTRRIAQFSNNRAPKPDDKIVYIDGAWDLFHIGHIEALEKAKALGTFLYVGIHDDKTVNEHKGRNYPVMDLHERVMNVLSCKWVDEVVMGAPWVLTADLIQTFNIHVVACGFNTKLDEDVASGADPYTVAKSMGIFQHLETSRTLQTADVVTRIIDNRLKYEARQKARAPKELNYIQTRSYVTEI